MGVYFKYNMHKKIFFFSDPPLDFALNSLFFIQIEGLFFYFFTKISIKSYVMNNLQAGPQGTVERSGIEHCD